MAYPPRPILTELFDAAVAAADPVRVLPAYLPQRPVGRTIVIGAGKAASQMASAFETAWDGPLEGAVVTRYGFGVPCQRIEVMEAAHPVPDAAGLRAVSRLRDLVGNLSADDLVVALVSGGGSALLPAPAAGLTLADEIAVNEALLASGAPISAMNAVRKQISTVKGGRLAAHAYPARVVSLVVSDVPGDDPALVASGPTVPDGSTAEDALDIVRTYRLTLPENVMHHLRSGGSAPLPDDPRLRRNSVHVVASARQSLEAAAGRAKVHGIEAAILSDVIEGEARDVGAVHAAITREIALRDRPFRKPLLLLSGGETTVTLDTRNGRGGRNGEFLLSFAVGVAGLDGVAALAADTDGIDGSESNAGAFADGSSVERMRAAGFDARACLVAHDSWGAFNAVEDLFTPGPTGTNVNDFRAVLIT